METTLELIGQIILIILFILALYKIANKRTWDKELEEKRFK